MVNFCRTKSWTIHISDMQCNALTFHFVLCSLAVRSLGPRRISFSKKHSMLWCRCGRSEEEETVVVRLFDRFKTNFFSHGNEIMQMDNGPRAPVRGQRRTIAACRRRGNNRNSSLPNHSARGRGEDGPCPVIKILSLTAGG